MSEADELRLRITQALLQKKEAQYHWEAQHGTEDKRQELLETCHTLRERIAELRGGEEHDHE